MFAETTCFYTADRHWIRVDELLKHPIVPLMVWRGGMFRYTQRPYTVRVEEKTRMMHRVKTVYQIDLLLSRNQKVPTMRGLVSAKRLLPDDEMHLYIDGKLLLTRPKDVHCTNRMRSYVVDINDGFALIARDIDSRWQAAYDIGILVYDCFGSGAACTRVIHKFLPPARINPHKERWKPCQESKATEPAGSGSGSPTTPPTNTLPIIPTP